MPTAENFVKVCAVSDGCETVGYAFQCLFAEATIIAELFHCQKKTIVLNSMKQSVI